MKTDDPAEYTMKVEDYIMRPGRYTIGCNEAGLKAMDDCFKSMVKEYCKGIDFKLDNKMDKYIRRKDDPSYNVIVWDGRQETVDAIKALVESNKTEEEYKGEFKILGDELFIVESSWADIVKLGDYILVTNDNWIISEKPENFEKKYEQA